MAMWSSRTNLWGKKTRPVNLKPAIKEIANGEATEHDNKEDYLEEEDKIKHLEAKLEFYKSLLDDKCKEIVGLQIQLSKNTEFMQKVVLELIHLKNTPTSAAPKTALEAYIANKNNSSTTTKAKLP